MVPHGVHHAIIFGLFLTLEKSSGHKGRGDKNGPKFKTFHSD
jgi:hypothetical protein